MAHRALLWLGAALAAAGCLAEPEGRTVRVAYPHELLTLDPHAHADTVTGTVLSAVYEGLVYFEPGLPVRPLLSDRWTTPDDLTWRLHVREGVRFHDGGPLVAADVIASIERARSSAVIGHQLDEIAAVREVEGEEGVVEIVTSRPAPLLLTRLEAVAIAPRAFDPLVPTGTGPYRWSIGSPQGPVVLRAWDGYWRQRPDFEEADIRFVEYQEELATLLHHRQLDVVASVSSSFVAGHRAAEGWRVEASRAVAVSYLGLNLAASPLDDPLVREAIEAAIDRPALVAAVFPAGTADPARSLVPAEVFGYSPAHRRPEADPGRARELLRRAALVGGARLVLDCAERYLPAAEHVAAALASVGLEVEVQAMPYEAFYRRLEAGESELFLFTWSFRLADASIFLDAFVHSRDASRGLGTFNGAGIALAEIDELIDLAAIEPNAATRLERLQTVLSRVVEINAYQPLYQPRYLSLVRDGFAVDGPALTMPRPQDIQELR